jgi:hypothetical protein
MTTPFTLIEDGERHDVSATVAADGVRLAPEALHRALGWQLKPEGLCQGDVCVPTAGRAKLVDDEGIDLASFADVLGLPLALDADAGVASLGRSAAEHAGALATGEAPDFTLPDLAGRAHSLSDYRGKKVLLIAYASW